LTTFLVDVAVIGTVAFCGWRGYKNGLIRGVFGVVSLILSLFIANFTAQAYSDDAKGILMPFISGYMESTLSTMAEEDVEYQELEHEHEVEDNDFGLAYTALREIGMPEAAAIQIAEQTLERRESDRSSFFPDIIADRLSSALSYVAVFGIAFLLIAIVFAVIGHLVGLVFALPGLRLVDIIAGSILGLAKGLILVYTLAVIIRYFGLLILPILEGTTVLNALVNNNPIANILGI